VSRTEVRRKSGGKDARASAVICPLSLSQHLSFPPRSRLQDVAVSAILAQLSCDFLAMISRARADLAARDKMHVISISTTGLFPSLAS
jgi:hypothetical protein